MKNMLKVANTYILGLRILGKNVFIFPRFKGTCPANNHIHTYTILLESKLFTVKVTLSFI